MYNKKTPQKCYEGLDEGLDKMSLEGLEKPFRNFLTIKDCYLSHQTV